jgi:hypothetical protein
MKSFFALALAAVAFADDASDKAAVADVMNMGTDTSPLSKAIPRPDVTLKTGSAAAKGTLKQSTGVRITTGTDGQTYFQYMFAIAPTPAYTPNSQTLDIAFAASKTAAKVDYTQWTSAGAGDLTILNYYYLTLERSIESIETDNTLTATQQTALTANRFFYTETATALINNNQPLDDKYWDVSVANSTVNKSGAQSIVMERKQPGVEELKAGGAALVYLKFKDGDGIQNIGSSYAKWADASAAMDDGAFYVSTVAALAAAVAATLF